MSSCFLLLVVACILCDLRITFDYFRRRSSMYRWVPIEMELDRLELDQQVVITTSRESIDLTLMLPGVGNVLSSKSLSTAIGHNDGIFSNRGGLLFKQIEPIVRGYLPSRAREELDRVELDGKTMKEDKGVVKRIKGEALKEKDNPGAFLFPIRLEGKVNKNALADTGSDINTMPYRIYETLGREEM
ncbi:hypothetical protein Tco_0963275 [Tanacetum coccineum]